MNSIPDGSTWQAACDSYSAQAWSRPTPLRAPYFAGFGVLHVAVAELLFERNEELNALDDRRVVHIESSAGLLAAYSPSKRVVQLRADNMALAHIARGSVLNVRVMPGSAGLLDGALAQGFAAWPVAALFWHYGQASLSALDHLPRLAQHALHIRRFPTLEPPALLLRQLHLIYLLSHHATRFAQLLPLLHEDQRAFICPDLASLYLTGTLRIGN